MPSCVSWRHFILSFTAGVSSVRFHSLYVSLGCF